MKKILLIVSFVIIGCKVDVGTNESEQFSVVPMTGEVGFTQLNKYVMSAACVRCHAWASDEIKVQQRIIFGDAVNSTLYQEITSGRMPPNGKLSTKQISLVEKYINNPNITPIKTVPLNSTFQSIQFHLIEKSCLGCHNNVTKKGKLSLEGYALISKYADDVIDILDFGESNGEPMPPIDEITGKSKAPVPSKEVVEAFRKWIEEGKLEN